ncbi:MAG: 50S ribosomal protein L3 [Thermoguttaceae bacterium]
MTQIYDESGRVVPVTVVQAGPCHVLQVRTPERDGYEAVQLGFLDKPRRLASRSQRGHVARLDSRHSKRRSQAGIEPLAKADCEPKRFVREFRGAVGDLAIGSLLDVGVFDAVKAVDVTGVSKGRGFAGVMKRHNFSGQRASHGVKKCHRHAGGTGCSAYPGRIVKGKNMAGQYGNTRCTQRNLQIVEIDKENHLLVIKGAIPGPNGGYLMISATNKV